MTNRIAFIVTLSLSFLFGVDRPKEIETSSQTTTEIQFDAEVFQKNLHIKKEIIQNYKQVRKAKSIERDKEAFAPMGHSQQPKTNRVDYKQKLNGTVTECDVMEWNDMGSLTNVEGSMSLSFSPFEIKTFKFVTKVTLF